MGILPRRLGRSSSSLSVKAASNFEKRYSQCRCCCTRPTAVANQVQLLQCHASRNKPKKVFVFSVPALIGPPSQDSRLPLNRVVCASFRKKLRSKKKNGRSVDQLSSVSATDFSKYFGRACHVSRVISILPFCLCFTAS